MGSFSEPGQKVSMTKGQQVGCQFDGKNCREARVWGSQKIWKWQWGARLTFTYLLSLRCVLGREVQVKESLNGFLKEEECSRLRMVLNAYLTCSSCKVGGCRPLSSPCKIQGAPGPGSWNRNWCLRARWSWCSRPERVWSRDSQKSLWKCGRLRIYCTYLFKRNGIVKKGKRHHYPLLYQIQPFKFFCILNFCTSKLCTSTETFYVVLVLQQMVCILLFFFLAIIILNVCHGASVLTVSMFNGV